MVSKKLVSKFKDQEAVECKKGRYDAFVYLDKMMLDDKEQSYVLEHLKRVSKHIQNHCMSAEGWYKAPNFKVRRCFKRKSK